MLRVLPSILMFLAAGLVCGVVAVDASDSLRESAAKFKAGDLILLGELHGTEQSPAFAASLVRDILDRNLEAVVGFELPSNLQQSADRFVDSPGSAGDRAKFLNPTFWTQDYQDGRGSRAMVDLLDEVRRLRGNGRKVRPLFFDASGPGGRETGMAARIATSVKAHPEAVHIILTGNAHSRTSAGGRRSSGHKPMGLLLTEQFADRVAALNVAHDGGTAWLSTPECGIVTLAPSHPGGTAGTIEIDPATRPSGHQGWYHVGTLSASVPAVGDHEPPIESQRIDPHANR